jgi:hypothetical protein
MQTLSHACLPLLYFLGQVIHFWMEEWTTFINVERKLMHSFSFIVTYLHIFERSWPS